MAISSAAELSTAICNWLDISSGQFAANQLTDLVMLGEKWIMRNVRNEDMEAALSVTISSGTATAPTGFLGLKYAYVDGSPTAKLIVKTPDQIYTSYPNRASTGKPAWIAYDAGSFIFGPYPDSTYTIKGTYYKRQGPLSSGTYNLFTNNPDLFLFAALAESELVFGRDERVPLWMAKRDQIAQAVNTEARNIASSGGMAITLG
jgi:hypothetical protein